MEEWKCQVNEMCIQQLLKERHDYLQKVTGNIIRMATFMQQLGTSTDDYKQMLSKGKLRVLVLATSKFKQ